MWKDAIEELEHRRRIAQMGGGAVAIERRHIAGKMTARERIEYLLDEGTFVEVQEYVTSRIDDFGMAQRRVPGDGVVTGYGRIAGRLVFVSSEDFTVIGGTLGEYHAQKIAHIQDMALAALAPIIFLNDSGGARIEEGVSSLAGYSSIFLRNTKASGVIPQIAVVLGPCCGGACYSPALCDFIFMVEDISSMFITGPGVVKAMVNEDITKEELGGARLHAGKSGVAHFAYPDERSCLDGVCALLSYLPEHCRQPYESACFFKQSLHPDSYEFADLCDIVPDNNRKPYDVKLVIENLVDCDSFFEVHKDFAMNAVVGFARISGNVVGIVANQPLVYSGSLDCDASDKMARFIRFCDCYDIPLITLIDVPAFYPGKEQESRGIIRHGAKLLYAYSEATVPKISLILRKAYGGAYIAMNSKKMGADIVYAWPIAEIAVIGAEGAVEIIFKKKIRSAENPEQLQQELKKQYEERFMNPYLAAERGYVDEVIRPDETRGKLIAALGMLSGKQEKQPWKKHGNIPL